MRKNKIMRFASLILVLTLLSTSVISGTFAKYTTTDSATDSARVAKWGVTVLASGNLFGEDYNPNSTADSVADDVIGTVTTSASSSDSDNIVAPGTKNDTGFTVSISGTPEVAWDVVATTTTANKDIFLGEGHWGVLVEATGLNDATDITTYYVEDGTNYKLATGTWDSSKKYFEMHDKADLTENYYPLEWTATGSGTVPALTKTHLAEIATEIATNLDTLSGNANETTANSYTLTWAWDFNNNDDADTILGNLIAGSSDQIIVYSETGTTYAAPAAEKYCTALSFDLTVTVNQVD